MGLGEHSRRAPPQHFARSPVAAMMLAIDARPQGAGVFRFLGGGPDQAGADAEQDPAAQHQAFRLQIVPRKGLQQRLPGIFELRQLLAGHAHR